MSADEWYYQDKTEARGPFPADRIRTLASQGVIHAGTKVWSEKTNAWQPLGETELGAGVPAAPAPGEFNPAAATGPRVQSFGAAVGSFFRKYATFQGRSNRPEYWYAFLMLVLVGVATVILDTMVIGSDPTQMAPINSIWSLATLLPSIAVGVRRLHDTDRTGWWILIGLIPIIGWIVIIVFACQKGTDGPNRFGAGPT